MTLETRRAVILDVIQEAIGDEAMKKHVAKAKALRPDLFAKPETNPVNSGEN